MAIRTAIVSTPRSGNTWLRHLLATTYGIPSLAVHELAEPEWADLPAECVLQLHWRRKASFAQRLSDAGFRVITIARHPLDTLISILQYALIDGDTHHWLHGSGGDESGLFGAMPRSRAFVKYACGPRAAELFTVTSDWWVQPGTLHVRYEDLTADPVAELSKLVGELGPPRVEKLADAVSRNTIDRLRPTASNGHFWQGKPGLWKQLIPAAEAHEIAAAIPESFSRYGYTCDPDPNLTADAADATWVRLAGPGIRTAIARASAQQREQVERAVADAQSAELRAERAEAELVRLRAELADVALRRLPSRVGRAVRTKLFGMK